MEEQVRYFVNHGFSPKDMYRFRKSKGKFSKKFYHSYSCFNSYEFSGKVLSYLMFLIIMDIIENNVTFAFPLTGKNEAYIFMDCFQDDVFWRCYNAGMFQGIDPLKSNFKAYRLKFQFTGKGGELRDRPVYITHNLRDYMYSLVNAGKEY